jgi:hypothetical protein
MPNKNKTLIEVFNINNNNNNKNNAMFPALHTHSIFPDATPNR